MNKLKYIEKLVKLTRPKARFVKAAYMPKIVSKDISIDDYFFVSLDDAKIDSVFNKCKAGNYIIQNSYLSSFAYNLYISAFIYHNSDVENEKLILKHNFKKFYAEQLLHSYNCIFSRSILIETILEEEKMRKVFEKIKSNPDLSLKADAVASLMSNLISFHELGHYIFQNKNGWTIFLNNLSKEKVEFITLIKGKYHPLFYEEIKCDIFAVESCLIDYNKNYSLKEILDIIIFGFSSFSVMFSLVKSAKATTDDIRKDYKEHIDFKSIKNIYRDYTYKIGIDQDFKVRASIVIEYCKIIAKESELILNPDNDSMNPDKIMDYLFKISEDIMNSDNMFIREVALLLSESLCNHPRGAEYLYIRSKVYKSKRKLE